MKKKEKEENPSTREDNNNSKGPLVPTCEKCGQPFTRCKCRHNDLKK